MAAPEPLDLPPPVTPFSVLDDNPAPPYSSPQHGYYAPRTQHTTQHAPPEATPAPPADALPTRTYHTPNDDAETASIASTVLPPYSGRSRYGIHKSEAEYLAALKAWAEQRDWVELEGQGALHGVYGNECLEDRSKRMTAERKAEKEAKAREKARKASLAEARGGGERRKSSISGWLGRQRRGSAAA